MPLHDWTRVTPNDFHDMHVGWITALRTRLNTGLLPEGYYAMAEHVVPPFAPDVLTLGTGRRGESPTPYSPDAGGVSAATRIDAEVTLTGNGRARHKPPERRVVVRHVQGRQLIAVIEVVSPGNKSKAKAASVLIDKSVALLQNGIHLTIIDVFPNPPRLPQGFGGAIWKSVERATAEYTPEFSRTHSSFAAQEGGGCLAHFQSSELGAPLPSLPLYLTPTVHVPLPLEEAYQDSWVGYPKPLRAILEAPAATFGEPRA